MIGVIFQLLAKTEKNSKHGCVDSGHQLRIFVAGSDADCVILKRRRELTDDSHGSDSVRYSGA